MVQRQHTSSANQHRFDAKMSTKNLNANVLFVEIQEIIEGAEYSELKKFLIVVTFVVVVVAELMTLRGGSSWCWWSQSPATFNLSH
jgi:hypothetical protein